jgi:PAS domain S-box-containing protein
MSAAAEGCWVSQDSKTELHTLFENSPAGLAECRSDGEITALNPAFERLLGDRATIALRTLRLADLVPQQRRAECERLFSELFAGQRDSFTIDSRGTGANGNSLRWTLWRVAATNRYPASALALAEAPPRDCEADQRMRQAQRLESVGRLAGGVAHDFNNLLTGILLYCDLLMAHLEPCHRVRKYAEEIRNAGMQATGLVRQLLAVSRPTNSAPRLLSLNEIAESMRNLLVRLIGENIELKFQLDPNLGLVRMDPTQSQQILLNLVLNARDAMPGGGQITVETRNCTVQVLPEMSPESAAPASLPCALFVVSDNGTGMDASTRAHLFEAFFTTKASKGTGLGLATVHDIVTANGGLIHVASAPASGTRVSVLLPLVPEGFVNTTREPQDFHPETIRGVLIPKE